MTQIVIYYVIFFSCALLTAALHSSGVSVWLWHVMLLLQYLHWRLKSRFFTTLRGIMSFPINSGVIAGCCFDLCSYVVSHKRSSYFTTFFLHRILMLPKLHILNLWSSFRNHMHKVLIAQRKEVFTVSDRVPHEHTTPGWSLNSFGCFTWQKCTKMGESPESGGLMINAAEMLVWNFIIIHPITVPMFQCGLTKLNPSLETPSWLKLKSQSKCQLWGFFCLLNTSQAVAWNSAGLKSSAQHFLYREIKISA